MEKGDITSTLIKQTHKKQNFTNVCHPLLSPGAFNKPSPVLFSGGCGGSKTALLRWMKAEIL